MKPIKNWILGGLLAVMLTATASAHSYVERVTNPYFDGDYATTLAKITPLAEAGDADAQYWLGDMYDWGRGVATSDLEARKWYRRAAKAGHAKAQYRLGQIYQNGWGVGEPDVVEAEKWFRLAAEAGHTDAQYELKKNTELVSIQRAAEAGSVEAQHALGFMYEYGEGVAQDDAEAAKWYRLAAEAGRIDAQHSLGYMYDEGIGVAEDDAEAVKWFRRAAEQGHTSSQNNLGFMYFSGEGVEQDVRLAYMWFVLAASQGNNTAKENLDVVAEDMTPEQIAEAKEIAEKCLAQDYKGC